MGSRSQGQLSLGSCWERGWGFVFGHLGLTSPKTQSSNCSFSSCFYLFFELQKEIPKGEEGYFFFFSS